MLGKISDVCSQVYSGGTPNRKHDEFYSGGSIPWLNTAEVRFNRIYSTEKNITDSGLKASSAKWVPANSVIVAMYGATAARTAIAKIPLTTNQACCNLIINDEIADYRYVYYWLYLKYNELASLANGGAQQNLNAGQIKDFPIFIPELHTQRAIADILSSLDDKIETNNRINQNLAEQAQTVFVQLFKDNESVTPATVADIALNVTDGVHNTVHDDPDGEYLLLSCKNIKGGYLSIGTSERTINKETFEKLRRRTKLAKGDVLISSVGTVGELLFLNTEPTNYEFQRSVAIVKPNPEVVSPAYLYESLVYQKAELINAAHGAVQQCLFISDIAGFPIGIPSQEDLRKFDEIVTPMFDEITANEAESIRLASLRDALLPKLMSGEIDVSEIDL